MLQIYFLQHWFNLSDPTVEEALYDSQAIRRFVGIDVGREPVPNETTVAASATCSRSIDLGRRLFDEVQPHLAAKGLKVAHRHDCRCDDYQCAVLDEECRQGAQSRDASDEKRNYWYFGMKGHFGVDLTDHTSDQQTAFAGSR